MISFLLFLILCTLLFPGLMRAIVIGIMLLIAFLPVLGLIVGPSKENHERSSYETISR